MNEPMSQQVRDMREAGSSEGQFFIDRHEVLDWANYTEHLERTSAALLAALTNLTDWSPADESGYCRFCNHSLHAHTSSCDWAIAKTLAETPAEPVGGKVKP